MAAAAGTEAGSVRDSARGRAMRCARPSPPAGNPRQSSTPSRSCFRRTLLGRPGRFRRAPLTAFAVLAAVAGCLIGPPVAVSAQTPGDTITLAAGPQYGAGSLHRFIFGTNWRELWVTELQVPVLDLRTFAGGLEPLQRGGGNQTITLHFLDASGRRWMFRSVDKRPGGSALGPDVQGTPAAGVIQDHTSILHPGGYFMLPPILGAVGVMHAVPQLFVMPDDPLLGEFRQDYAGMLGEIELRADEGPDNTPGFGGSRSVKNSENFRDDLESAHEHRLDEAELLRARLVDFLVGDPDRGTDQWRWARYGDSGAYTWRPIPVDRDWAFARADGVLAYLARDYYGKLVRFGDDYPGIFRMTYSSHIVDRNLLTRLTRSDFMEQAEQVRAAVTDAVIDSAVATMPPQYVAASGAGIAASLRARRDRIPAISAEFYSWLATEVDVRGTDERDYAELERRADGSVRVRIWPRDAVTDVSVNDAPANAGNGGESRPPAWYDRVFLPRETREVRVYLHGGDDHARVVGIADGPITLRVIAGGGDDLLEDHAGNARFYVERGDNRTVLARGTRVDDRSWHAPEPEEGLRVGSDWAPDFGARRDVSPAVGYGDRSGVLVGVAFNATRHGFRRLPHSWDMDVRALYAPRTGGVGVALDLDQRVLNSRATLHLDARATSLESFRFHGFGNASAAGDGARHGYSRMAFEPGVSWTLGRLPGVDPPDDEAEDEAQAPDDEDADTDADERLDSGAAVRGLRRVEGMIRVGPAIEWTRLDAAARSARPELVARDAVTQVGVRALVDLRRVDRRSAPRRGFSVHAEGAVYPLNDGADAFGTLATQLAAYVPLLGDGPHLAIRLGGERAFGDFPVFHAAFLGGRHSLRGARTERWAGDASAFGSAELRVPVDTVTLLVRTEVGVFGFTDVGRVWFDGASPGGWKSGYGAGGWMTVLGRVVSVAVARAEGTRVHAWMGVPF